MKMRGSLLALVGVAAFLEGCPSCPYDEACDGNVLRYCTVGVDQLVGSPGEGETACASPNPVCATVDARNAVCAIALERRCGAQAPPRCEGGLLVSCVDGFEVAYDCVAHGNVCGIDEGAAKCHRDPIVRCTVPTFDNACDGTRVLECGGTVVVAEDCALTYPGGTCMPVTNDYGTTAYCRGP